MGGGGVGGFVCVFECVRARKQMLPLPMYTKAAGLLSVRALVLPLDQRGDAKASIMDTYAFALRTQTRDKVFLSYTMICCLVFCAFSSPLIFPKHIHYGLSYVAERFGEGAVYPPPTSHRAVKLLVPGKGWILGGRGE